MPTRAVLTAWVAGCCLVISSHARGQRSDPLEDLFARGRAQQASVTSLAASFVETTVSSLLREPIVARGTLVAARPARIVMRYDGPDGRTIYVDETYLTVTSAAKPAGDRLNIAETQRRVQKYFVDASTRELRQSFDIVLANDPAPDGPYRLDMTPKRKQIKEGLQRLRLWIDRDRLLLIKMAMEFPGGDSKTLVLSDVRLNVPIDARTFAVPGRGGGERR
jgi:outer membrane lipoprotein-sorting protein